MSWAREIVGIRIRRIKRLSGWGVECGPVGAMGGWFDQVTMSGPFDRLNMSGAGGWRMGYNAAKRRTQT